MHRVAAHFGRVATASRLSPGLWVARNGNTIRERRERRPPVQDRRQVNQLEARERRRQQLENVVARATLIETAAHRDSGIPSLLPSLPLGIPGYWKPLLGILETVIRHPRFNTW